MTQERVSLDKVGEYIASSWAEQVLRASCVGCFDIRADAHLRDW